MGQGGDQILQQLIAGQNPQQTPPTPGGENMLNAYNNNPYQQNQMGSMGYGMMNQLMAKMMNPQAMQNPMQNPMFTTGAGYQPPMMQPNFNYGANMTPIAGQPSPYGYTPPVAPPLVNRNPVPKKRSEGGNK